MTTTIGSLDLNAFNDLYSDSNQYFWFEPNASATYGAGAHVTLVPDTSFISNPTGQNILMNTDGFSIRNGLLPMMTLDNNSLDFNVVDTTAGTYTTTATFTSTGAQIGQSSGAHSVIDANGQRFYATNGTTQLANIGYGEGVNATGSTSIAPYYTLGRREDGSTIGNYSVAECAFTTASAYASHAEGHMTIASGSWGSHAEGELTIASAVYSHAEGRKTSARGAGSHAEGYCTHGIGSVNGIDASGNGSHAEGWAGSNTNQKITASGIGSHAEGYADGIHGNIEASGNGSHVQGAGTKAQSDYQTVIGTSNIVDSTDNYAFIIGNGTADDARSNALTVDWSGNVDIASGASYSIGGVPIADYIVEQGTSDIWTYRKWASGISECWGIVSFTSTGSTAWGNVYWVTPITRVNFPTSLFTSAPTISVSTPNNAVQGWGASNNISASWVDVFLMRPTSAGSGLYIRLDINAKGRWK